MTHINVRDVLDSLTLAKEAYDAVPDLRRQIDDLQAAVASKDRLINQVQTQLGETIQGKANVEAKLKQTEEERDAYGFRAIDAEEKLEKVFGVVKPAVTPVQPPQPVTTAEASTPVDHTYDKATDANYPTEVKEPVGPTLTTTGTTEPIGDTKPEPLLNHPENWGKQSDSGDESTHAVIDKPYLGHPSWEKPHDMSWNEWETKGGTVPGWMKHNG